MEYADRILDRIEKLAAAHPNLTISVAITLPILHEAKPTQRASRSPRVGDAVLTALYRHPDWIGKSLAELAKLCECDRSTLSKDKQFREEYARLCDTVGISRPRGIYDARTGGYDAASEGKGDEWENNSE